MTGIAAASFFSNTCRFGGCGLHFPTLADLIEHIEDNHIDTDPRVLEKQELQQPTYVALSYINRFMTDAARREQESLKKKIQPKLSLTLSSSVSRGNVSTPPRHSSGSLTPPVTPPITPSSSFRSSTPTGSEYDEEEVDYEESDSDESWTTESAISSEAILSSMCMNGGEEKPFACPVPGCKKRYKVKARAPEPSPGGGGGGAAGGPARVSSSSWRLRGARPRGLTCPGTRGLLASGRLPGSPSLLRVGAEVQRRFFWWEDCGVFFIIIIHERQREREREREREAETQAEGGAGSTQGARRGTRSRVSRITPRAEGGAKPLGHPGCPKEGPSLFFGAGPAPRRA
uniref:JAZF zinc finger 1 n=1 Tax=Canis lupus familiaris TaxID=9615 RepID=A0A8P0PKT3_CANLF